jgi:hypothetical protein
MLMKIKRVEQILAEPCLKEIFDIDKHVYLLITKGSKIYTYF